MPDVPALIDTAGRPLRAAATRADLSKAVAFASLTGVRQAWTGQQVAAGLTPQRLARVMRQAAEGDHLEYVILAEEMEERDWHYAAALSQRKLVVLGLERVVQAASDDAADKEIADAVRRDIIEDEAFEDLLGGALDAIGKGWSAVEIAWRTDPAPWLPESYEWRDPRWFRWDRGDRARAAPPGRDGPGAGRAPAPQPLRGPQAPAEDGPAREGRPGAPGRVGLPVQDVFAEGLGRLQ